MKAYLSLPEERRTEFNRRHPIIVSLFDRHRHGINLDQARDLKRDLERAIKELEHELVQGRME